MTNDEYSAITSNKILQAATQLFAMYGYEAVAVKQITSMAGVNSALISYYFDGKKKLYQKVLTSQVDVFKELINEINSQNIPPLEKLHRYVHALSDFQKDNANAVRLIYREILNPQPMLNNFVKDKLYMLHIFMKGLISESIKDGTLRTTITPTHAAFTIEGIILFYFLMHNEVRELGEFAPGDEGKYLEETLITYIDSLK